jgi:hypothetical protein
MRQLAVDATAARLGADFGPRAAELARDAVRLQECLGLGRIVAVYHLLILFITESLTY